MHRNALFHPFYTDGCTIWMGPQTCKCSGDGGRPHQRKHQISLLLRATSGNLSKCEVARGGVRWCQVVCDSGVWWFAVVWWCMVVYGGVWWCVVVCGGVQF